MKPLVEKSSMNISGGGWGSTFFKGFACVGSLAAVGVSASAVTSPAAGLAIVGLRLSLMGAMSSCGALIEDIMC